MTDHQLEPSHSIDQANEARQAVSQAGRWFAGYLALLGAAATVWILVLETVFSSGVARNGAAVAGGLLFGGTSWWAETHDVHPRGAGRTMLIATAVWFGAYLVLVGPLVRWQAGESLGWWALVSALLASPFFVAAWRHLRAS